MSAIHIYLNSDAVHVLTDGAAYNGDGVLLAILSKTIPLPHLNGALTCIGPSFVGPHLAARILESFTTFDELVAGIVAKVRQSVEADRSLFAQVPGAERFSVYLTGISESSGPCAYVVHGEGSGTSQAWELEELPGGMICPCTPEFQAAIANRSDLLFDADEFDPAVHGLAILSEQRQHAGEIVGTAARCHVIGGQATLVTIRRDATTIRVLRRWDDRIGERIEPAADRHSRCGVSINSTVHRPLHTAPTRQ